MLDLHNQCFLTVLMFIYLSVIIKVHITKLKLKSLAIKFTLLRFHYFVLQSD